MTALKAGGHTHLDQHHLQMTAPSAVDEIRAGDAHGGVPTTRESA